MFDSISTIPSSQEEAASCGGAMSWDAIASVNGTPAHENNLRTFLTKASSFFAELKRRKVYKVAVAYAVISWLLIQAASILLPTFDAPPCMMRAFIVLLAIGFVFSVILSWIFDITPQGIMRTANISPDRSIDIVRQLEAQARQEFARGYLSALVYAGLGDKTNAIDYLKHEYLDHDNFNHASISVDAMLDALRCDPRFASLAQRPQ